MVAFVRCVLVACVGVAVAGPAGGAGATAVAASRSGGMIVYWSESPFPSIWAIRPDGSHRFRILRNRQNAKRPALSPDRRWVAFDGAPPGKAPLSDFDLQIVRLDGTRRKTLTRSPQWDVDAQWSPDGRRLSFSRQPPRSSGVSRSVVWIIDRDGTGRRRLAPGYGARWAPDGTRLVYEAPSDATGQLFTINVDGSEKLLLLSVPEPVQPAGWSPNGVKILFTRFHSATGGGADVYVMNADGTNVRRLAHGYAGSWSPDGRKIVYTATAGSTSLRIMNADGSEKRRIASGPAADPNWR
jgi:Tol biopolymer transport system component